MGLLGYEPSLKYDGEVEEVVEKYGVGEIQGIREGLLQEEWPADTLGHRCSDGLCAGIPPQVTQPVHTGMDEWMDRYLTRGNVTGFGSDSLPLYYLDMM